MDRTNVRICVRGRYRVRIRETADGIEIVLEPH